MKWLIVCDVNIKLHLLTNTITNKYISYGIFVALNHSIRFHCVAASKNCAPSKEQITFQEGGVCSYRQFRCSYRQVRCSYRQVEGRTK
jgi:hypothetical protein